MKIAVESKDVRAIWALRDGPMPDGVRIEVDPASRQGAISVTGLKSPIAIISAPADAAIGPLADWLYDKLKDKLARLTINRRQVEIDKRAIVQVLHEEISKT